MWYYLEVFCLLFSAKSYINADIPADAHNESKINISLVYKMFV
jgi:hypothetical protein